MSADANNHGSPADEQLEFENSSQFTRGLHAQAEIIPDISSHDGMKSIKSDIQSVPKERLEQRQSPRALKKKRQAQVGHGDTVTASKDFIQMDTPPQPAPAPRQTTGTTSLSHNKIERMSALAKREIARLELAQKRAHLRAASHERAAAQAAAANISSIAVNGQQRLHEPDDIQRLNEIWARQDSLRLRTNAQDAKMNAGVKYERKTQGPFSGKLVSQGTIINIDGEGYVEYRVLKKPLPL
ncbi:hypothetical protein AU210_016367 [Fusarium oxysporum f. sp. radicis-cucumerinum]|uniref:Uncharacterized protein n=1 Tax=Fusarium oxysporum f. sp. radicis-cucumerinum TaxID=327505 RepID=A0A2H3GAM4_FUSOX|nr:hypothetical protein AU210_016367 [Fusarium oxysporum f. sp. radicis-cucumerinum]